MYSLSFSYVLSLMQPRHSQWLAEGKHFSKVFAMFKKGTYLCRFIPVMLYYLAEAQQNNCLWIKLFVFHKPRKTLTGWVHQGIVLQRGLNGPNNHTGLKLSEFCDFLKPKRLRPMGSLEWAINLTPRVIFKQIFTSGLSGSYSYSSDWDFQWSKTFKLWIK